MHSQYNYTRPTRGTPPQRQERKLGAGAKALIALLTLLVYAGAAAGTFLLSGGAAERAPALPGYTAQGEARILRLAPPSGGGAAELAAYFGAAADFAREGGYNTVLFTAREGLGVWWRDDIFPAAPGIAEQDSFTRRLDPLEILCGVLEGEELQLWIELDPYAALGESGSSEAEKLLQKRGGRLTADDGEYRGLLVRSLSALPRRYSMAGIVLRGFASAGEGEAANSAFTASLGETLSELSAALAESSYQPVLGLSFSAGATRLSPALAGTLAQGGALSYLLPEAADTASAIDAMRAYAAAGARLIAVQPAAGDGGQFLFAAHRQPAYAGALLAAYPADAYNTEKTALLSSALAAADVPLPEAFAIPQKLAVTFPDQGATIDYGTTATDFLFVTGVSDPALPLLLDGAEVPNRAAGGAFGVSVELAVGQNSYTFTQGADSYTLTVTRPAPGGGGGGGGTLPEDATPEAMPGQAVRVTSLIASVLIDPHNDFSPSLNETLPRGATFIAEGSVRTVRGGRRTWAYRMESGEYVLASNCEFAASGAAAFTGITARAGDGGEWLDFTGTGSPAAYVAYEAAEGGAVLRLTFYDTALSVQEGFTSAHVSSALVQAEGGATVLTLNVRDLWGYSLEYTENGTGLYLKSPPKRGADPARPLDGVRIMLDPGHGDTDIGAPGVMGSTGPNEKHLNLALAQTIAYRLRQLGAEVSMTREGDSLPTLMDRLAAQTAQKPDFFLSVHHNSIMLDRDRNDVRGLEAYYFHPYDAPPSRAFAANLLSRVSAATGRPARNDGRPAWGAYYVTRTTVCPSVLFEYGFMPNPAEFEYMSGEQGITAAAFATAEAIIATLPV